MIGHRQTLKLLVVVTFAFAVVTIVTNIKYVLILPNNRASRLVFPRAGEEKTLFIGKSFDTTACAVPATFINDSKVCKVPNVDPYSDFVMEALKPVRSITCPGRLYTEYKNNLFRLLDDVSEGLLHCFILCNFKKKVYFKHTSQHTKSILQTYFTAYKKYTSNILHSKQKYTLNILPGTRKVHLKHTSVHTRITKLQF